MRRSAACGLPARRSGDSLVTLSRRRTQTRTFEEVSNLTAEVRKSQAMGGGNEAAIAAAAGMSLADATAEMSDALAEIKKVRSHFP